MPSRMMLWPPSQVSVPAFSNVRPLSRATAAPPSIVEEPRSNVVPVPSSRSFPPLANSMPFASTSVPIPLIVPPACRNLVSSDADEATSKFPLPEISTSPPFAIVPADALVPLSISVPPLTSTMPPFAAVSTPVEVPPPVRSRVPAVAVTVPLLISATPISMAPVSPDLSSVPALTKLSLPALATMP